MATSSERVTPTVERIIDSQRNVANGLVSIESDGTVLGTFCSRRDTAANLSVIVLEAGELAYASDTGDIFMGDGSTPGGVFIQGTPRQFGYEASLTLSTNPSIGTTDALIVTSLVENATYEIKAYGNMSGGTTTNFAIMPMDGGFFYSPLFEGSSLSQWGVFHWSDGTMSTVANGSLPGVYISSPSINLTLPAIQFEMSMVFTHGTFYGDWFKLTPASRSGSQAGAEVKMIATIKRIA